MPTKLNDSNVGWTASLEEEYQLRRREILDYVAELSSYPYPTRFGDYRTACGYFLALLEIGDLQKASILIDEAVEDVSRDLHKINGMSLGGDLGDFRIAALLRAYLRFGERTPTLPWEKVRSICLRFEYPRGGMSENHNILFATSELLAAQTWRSSVFADGEPAESHLRGAEEYIRTWIESHIDGFEEWNSDAYCGMDLAALYNIYDFAESPSLRRASAIMIDLILGEMATNSFRGNHCAASGRTYSDLLFGTGETHASFNCMSALFQATSNYRPPRPIVDIARDEHARYVCKGRHVYPGRARRDLLLGSRGGSSRLKSEAYYTLRTPLYMLSSAQQLTGRRGYTEQVWQATFGERAVVFSNHPGSLDVDTRPGYWQGNGYVPYCFQNLACIVCVYNIQPDHPLPFIHIWLPKHEFDEVADDGEDGWIFVRKGSAYLGIRTMEPHFWIEYGVWADREVRSFGIRNAVICEVSSADESHTFEEFKQDLRGTRVNWRPKELSVQYSSRQSGTISVVWRGPVTLDGRPVNASSYPRIDAPCFKEVERRLYEISRNGRSLTLDLRGHLDSYARCYPNVQSKERSLM